MAFIMGKELKDSGYDRHQVAQLCARSGLVVTRAMLAKIFSDQSA